MQQKQQFIIDGHIVKLDAERLEHEYIMRKIRESLIGSTPGPIVPARGGGGGLVSLDPATISAEMGRKYGEAAVAGYGGALICESMRNRADVEFYTEARECVRYLLALCERQMRPPVLKEAWDD